MNNIINGGFPKSNYYRYRIGIRGEWLNKVFDKDIKVTHSND